MRYEENEWISLIFIWDFQYTFYYPQAYCLYPISIIQSSLLKYSNCISSYAKSLVKDFINNIFSFQQALELVDFIVFTSYNH
jgi:hypothetical protein